MPRCTLFSLPARQKIPAHAHKRAHNGANRRDDHRLPKSLQADTRNALFRGVPRGNYLCPEPGSPLGFRALGGAPILSIFAPPNVGKSPRHHGSLRQQPRPSWGWSALSSHVLVIFFGVLRRWDQGGLVALWPDVPPCCCCARCSIGWRMGIAMFGGAPNPGWTSRCSFEIGEPYAPCLWRREARLRRSEAIGKRRQAQPPA